MLTVVTKPSAQRRSDQCLHGSFSVPYQGSKCTILQILFLNYPYPTVIMGYLYNHIITELPNNIVKLMHLNQSVFY